MRRISRTALHHLARVCLYQMAVSPAIHEVDPSERLSTVARIVRRAVEDSLKRRKQSLVSIC
jgi:hypothetical protein